MALLELVDNPRDFKLEMTARAVGRDLLTEKLRWNSPRGVLNSGVDALESISREVKLGTHDKGELRPATRRNLQKVIRYRGNPSLRDVGKKASAWIVSAAILPCRQFTLNDFSGHTFRHATSAEEGADGSGRKCGCQKQSQANQLCG